MNRRSLKLAGRRFKGVSFHKKQLVWIARIKHEGRSIFLGTFPTERDAALAYNVKAASLFKEFALLNVLEDREKVA